MARTPIVVGPFATGMQNNVDGWLIQDDAFTMMRNAYCYRNRIIKRFGTRYLGSTQLTSRLRINLGTHDSDPKTVPLPDSISTIAVGQLFSIGDTQFTVYQTGAGVATYTTGAITAQIDTTVSPNTITFTGAATGSTIFWYPSKPVMGILDYEQQTINKERTFVFDQNYVYEYAAGSGFNRITGGVDRWSGTDAEFFQATTWRGPTGSERYMFVTNYNATDEIRYYDGSTWTQPQWATLSAGTNRILTARLVFVFANRLVLLNTIELVNGAQQTFVNRMRASQIGNPTVSADAFRTDTAGLGIALDAATSEAIISAEFLKNRLIVYFERSTWALVPTGNQVYPFVWQKINTELGAESTFSVIPFDQSIVAIGNVGIHGCNGTNVARIDEKIPNEIFKVRDRDDGVFRVHGIRDYFNEMVYWSLPTANGPQYPNQVLIYNYIQDAWSFADDTITTFGYIQESESVTWNSRTVTWNDTVPWDSGRLQAQFRQVVCGNQQGYVTIIDQSVPTNEGRLQITDMTTAGVLTIINHNLEANTYIYITDAIGITGLNNQTWRIESITTDTLTLDLNGTTLSGTYAGGGTAASVSRIDLHTKQYNYFTKDGRNIEAERVEFLVDRLGSQDDNYRIAVDYFISTSTTSQVDQAIATNTITGTKYLDLSPFALFPDEVNRTRVWHPYYVWSEGEVLQLRIFYDDTLMVTDDARQPFVLHSMLLYVAPQGRLE